MLACLIPSRLDSQPGIGHVYLTWQSEEMLGNMTIVFHSDPTVELGKVRYAKKVASDKEQLFTQSVQATSRTYTQLNQRIHVANLTNLEAGATYAFVVGNQQIGFSPPYYFKALDSKAETIHFITGGDMDVGERSQRFMQIAGKLGPDFVMVGGDIAYANGRVSNAGRWQQWFRMWQKFMVRSDGTLIPVIAAIGNHEVAGGFHQSPEQAPFYLAYFPQTDDRRTYFVRTLGKRAVFFVLDSGHANSHALQRQWLDRIGKNYSNFPMKFALYHVPLFPSYRDPMNEFSKLGRQHWMEAFDQLDLTAAFENHEHTLKRSPALHFKAGTKYRSDVAKEVNVGDQKNPVWQTSGTYFFW